MIFEIFNDFSDACDPYYLSQFAVGLLVSPFLRPVAASIAGASRPFANLGVVLLVMLLNFAAAFVRQLGRLHVSTCRCHQPPCSLHDPEHYRRSLDS